jgi:hypothetical protein
MLAKTNMGEFAISPLESRVSRCVQAHHVRRLQPTAPARFQGTD